nr:MAG TPA: hypothetical protein [Caudoviricetes sp.]
MLIQAQLWTLANSKPPLEERSGASKFTLIFFTAKRLREGNNFFFLQIWE